MIFAVDQPEVTLKILRTAGRLARPLKHRADITRPPGSGNQPLARIGCSGRRLNELNNFIDVGECNRKTFQDVTALSRLTKKEQGSTCHHFATMTQEGLNDFLEVQHLGLTIDKGHHVDTNH